MSTTTLPDPLCLNPFRQSYRQRLRALGGKYKPSDVNTDRNIMFMESMIDFERERWRQIEAARRNEPTNPF